jgi:ubiquinone/menaquinone biosynthesis C-methylase UbiE
MLSREQARAFYDRFGAKQDWQRFYERTAIRDLLAHGAFEEARAVFELGCGTGWLAGLLLAGSLPESATYVGFDLSSTMVTLAGNRLARYGGRARVEHTDGSPELPFPERTFDRFISTYVLDILPPEEIRIMLGEARRVLVPGGRLCLVSLTEGCGTFSRVLIAFWKRVYGFRPGLVGGCRPLKLLDFISEQAWELVHHDSVAAFGVPSEVVVARRKNP